MEFWSGRSNIITVIIQWMLSLRIGGNFSAMGTRSHAVASMVSIRKVLLLPIVNSWVVKSYEKYCIYNHVVKSLITEFPPQHGNQIVLLKQNAEIYQESKYLSTILQRSTGFTLQKNVCRGSDVRREFLMW